MFHLRRNHLSRRARDIPARRKTATIEWLFSFDAECPYQETNFRLSKGAEIVKTYRRTA
jgi:hypothetical protein